MKLRLFTGAFTTILLLTPLAVAQDDRKPSPTKSAESKSSGMSHDMKEAIEFERAKDRAAARQARIEARKGNSDRSADRVMDDKDTGGKKVKDTKAPGAKRDQ